MVNQAKLDSLFDAHLHKKLTPNLARKMKDEIMTMAGNKRLQNRGSRTATVAIPAADGSVSAQQIKPSPHGTTPTNKNKTIVIGHPDADEE